MKRVDFLLCFLLATAGLFSRVPFLEKVQSHWDGPNYTIAVVRYSLEQHTPVPPGYPLYIAVGKLFNLIFPDPHRSILFVSVLGCIFGALICYIVGKKIYNRPTGLIAAIILLTGSTFYYFGLTTYAYGLIPATTTLLAYSVYRIFIKNKQEGILLGLIFGICFGIRPQETLQIGLLALLGFLPLQKKQKILSILFFAAVTLFWLIPLIHISGGFTQYLKLHADAAMIAFQGHTLSQHTELMIKGFLLSFGVAPAFLIYYLRVLFRKNIKINRKLILFYAIWIIPGLLFNLLIRTEHAGYQMSYLSGLLLLIAYALWKTTQRSKLLTYTTVIFIGIFNLFWFFFDRDPKFEKPYRPTSFHYSDIRKNDLKVGSKVRFVVENFDPQKTLILSTDALWRPYSYYLKAYPLYALFGLDNTEIPYSYGQIESINWDMRWYQNKRFTILIPPNITNVVFMDDAMSRWIKNYPIKTYRLPGNSTITSITISPNTQLRYKYHSIEVVKK